MIILFTVRAKSLENFEKEKEKTDLKIDIYNYLNENFESLFLNSVSKVNNFHYNDMAKNIIKHSYRNEGTHKVKEVYYFSSPINYYNALDFIILYSYNIVQGLYAKNNIPELVHNSLTEIINNKQNVLIYNGINLEYPYHQLSLNYKENDYIDKYLNIEIPNYLEEINYESLTNRNKNYYLVIEDILKMIKMKQGFHYKNSYSLWKDRFFILSICLQHLNFTHSEIKKIIEDNIKETTLNLTDSDINFLSNVNKYNYHIPNLYDKVKYSYSRYKDFNIYDLK